jgi:diguanylate cyclase (GGDEF)-like protein
MIMVEEPKKMVNVKDWLDPLTGIFSQTVFENQLAKELHRAARYNHPLSILMLDIDEFKKINEEFGSPTGDQVLKELSRILEENIRAVDIVARYEGDGFVILLPETRKAKAHYTAERILKNIRDHDFFKDKLRVLELRVSIGIAGFPEDSGKTKELMNKVVDALRQAKKDGGSRFTLYGEQKP